MADWRIVLCDTNGVALHHLTALARDRSLAYRLNGIQKLSFTVPSNDPLVANDHTDGYPLLDSGRRIIKAYRKETATDGTFTFRLRYAGLVWSLQDVGDTDSYSTAVSCVDLFARLGRRFTGKRSGAEPTDYATKDGGYIAKTLIDTTNAVSPTGVTTAGGTLDTTPTRTISYDRRNIGDAIVELATAFNGFDFYLEPLDAVDGTLARFHVYARRGGTKPEAVFGWGAGPNNVNRVERLVSMETFASTVTGVGAPSGTADTESSATSAGATADFGRYEAIDSFSDISSQTFLDALVTDELAFRVARRELVQFVPAADISPSPFDDFDLGDLVPIYAGSKLRGGFGGYQRVYGFDLLLDNDGRELTNAIYAAQEG